MIVAGFVLGIISIVLSVIPIFGLLAGPALGAIGVVLAIIGRNDAVTKGNPTGMATAGFVLSLVGLVLGILIYASCHACVDTATSGIKQATDITKYLR